jgi:hypothetical protein
MKQAVVVIHGIGEQLPMATLRNFVSSVLDEREKPEYPKFHNKPDYMSTSYEQRLLRSLKEGRRPTTDFYECYWAHHMRFSKKSQVYQWIAGLVLRKPWSVPKALIPVYMLLWFGAIGIIALFATGMFSEFENSASVKYLLGHYGVHLSILGAIAQALFSYFLLRYVADAARYLNPSPSNIYQRNKIRKEGLELLRNLHNSGKYSRVIVVGHSLGSVIGYDLIRLLWDEMRNPRGAKRVNIPEIEIFEAKYKEIFSKANTQPRNEQIQSYQELQYDLWRAMRTKGVDTPWLITDFVTLGSPLTYGKLLMSKNEKDFNDRVAEFEYPTCPPSTNVDGLYYSKNFEIDQNGKKIKVSRDLLHHGAPFAPTRWANIYFKYRCLLLGDMIGGRLETVFGPGVKDIEVAPTISVEIDGGCIKKSMAFLKYLISLTLFSHVLYWEELPTSKFIEKFNKKVFKSQNKTSLQSLKSELHL